MSGEASADHGLVYLLHLDRPYRHARHYTGWTAGELDTRLKLHQAGAGARLLQVVAQAGIGWTLARLFQRCTVLCSSPLKAGMRAPPRVTSGGSPAWPHRPSVGTTVAPTGSTPRP